MLDIARVVADDTLDEIRSLLPALASGDRDAGVHVAALFTALDESLCHGGDLPAAWDIDMMFVVGGTDGYVQESSQDDDVAVVEEEDGAFALDFDALTAVPATPTSLPADAVTAPATTAPAVPAQRRQRRGARPFEDPAIRARSSDPDTSHQAAASVHPSELRRRAQAVLAALTKLGPRHFDGLIAEYKALSVEDPLTYPKQSDSGIRTRVSELARAGLVRDSGRKGLTASGRQAIVWEVI